MLPSNDLHGRAMIWMSMAPGDAHFDTVMASGQGGTYILGGMYTRGHGVAGSAAEGARLAKRACELGEERGCSP